MVKEELTSIEMFDYYTEELSHHGILGQKWGRKQGPPYPLDASDHSASEKKAGWRSSLESAVSKITKKKSVSSNAEVKKQEPKKEETEEERKTRIAAEKKRIIESGNAELVRANATSLSYQELNEAVNRVNLMQRLDQMSPTPDTRNKIDKAIDVIDENATRVQKGINTYNKVAKIYNSFAEPPLPVIDKSLGERRKEDAEKQKKKEREAAIKELKKHPEKWLKYANSLDDSELQAIANRAQNLTKMKTQLGLFDKADDKSDKSSEKQVKQETKQQTPKQENKQQQNQTNQNAKQTIDINVNVNDLSTNSQQQQAQGTGKKNNKNKQNSQQNSQNKFNTTTLQNEVLNYATQKTLETELKSGMESYNKALYERTLSAMAESPRFSIQKMDDVERYGFRHSDSGTKDFDYYADKLIEALYA